MDTDPLVRLFAYVVLVFAHAFFVAADACLVALRAEEPDGSRGDELARSLAAQWGSTLCVVALVGLVATSLPPWPRLGQGALALGALVVDVVFGQQLPKLLGLQRADGWVGRVTQAPLRWWTRLWSWALLPLRWLLTRAARALGLRSTSLHPVLRSPEDLRRLLDEIREEGAVAEEEGEMLDAVLELSRTVAREVMTPRTEMVAVPTTVTLDELLATIATTRHSRLPVYEGSLDNIVGIVLAKDVLAFLHAEGPQAKARFDVRRLMRPPYFVPASKPVDELIAEFRQNHVHLAIVLDEFGGTEGLITMEDLLEEVVGEIHDEDDAPEPPVRTTPEGDVLLDGAVAISDANAWLDLQLPDDDYDTVGGYVFGALGRVPQVGDVVTVPGRDGPRQLVVESVEERRATRLRLRVASPRSEGSASDALPSPR